MTDEKHALGGRLPLLDPATMPPEQRRFYDVAMAEQHPWSVDAGFQLVTDDERLIGPFDAFLRRPEISERFGDFSESVVQGSSLSPRLREVVVLAVEVITHDESRPPSRVEPVQRIRGDDAVPTSDHRDHATTA
jgi:hypothetical protein